MDEIKKNEGESPTFLYDDHNSSCEPFLIKLIFSSGGVLPGIKPAPPDCSGCKVRELHHGTTTPSNLNECPSASRHLIE